MAPVELNSPPTTESPPPVLDRVPADSTAAGPEAAPAVHRASRGLRRALVWGVLFSLALHAVVVVVSWRIPLPDMARRALRELTTALIDEQPLPENLPDPILDLADVSEQPAESALAAQPTGLASTLSELTEIAPTPTQPPAEPLEVTAARLDVSTAPVLDQVLVRSGGLGEQVAAVDGAVDLITHEIANYLAESDLLVVWLMDASISLVDDRQAVADRLQRIYRELGQVETLTPGSLKAAVDQYGADCRQLVPPTVDGDAIIAGIREVTIDETGKENVFSAIVEVAQRYKALRSAEKRKIMIVIWTDESGDDESKLENAIDVCRRLAIPVYTVGPSSMFGQRIGKHPYRDPETGEVHQLPVVRGPDTVRPELLRLPFWFENNPLPELKSGLGPYSLVRLSRESGGNYLINDDPREARPFSGERMRRYRPDYSSAEDYLRSARGSKLREAILNAVEVTWRHDLRGTPELEFAPTADNYQELLQEAQKTAALNLYVLNECLASFGDRGLEPLYEAETSPRWRAWYDLTLGRLLAMRVRCQEYNLVCAEMKAKGTDFVEKQSNRWRFEPAPQLRGGTPVERTAAEAMRLLERCRGENPGTPWGDLAERELAHPLGFALRDYYVPPPPPPVTLPPGNDPPEPMGRRQEQLRMLNRQPSKLPNL